MSRIFKTFCTTREAASMLGVSVSTIQNWAEAGVLESWKTEGGHRRITRQSVEKLLNKPALQASTPNELPRAPEDRQRLRILIVEDDTALLRLYQIRISNWPSSPVVETAKNGFEGLVKIGLHRPDLLITDLQMPYIDGFRMLNALSTMDECNAMQIVVVSGQEAGNLASAQSLPADIRFLSKPLAYKELEKIAQRTLDRKRNGGRQ